MAETQKQAKHALADWIGDIVALESHVEEAMDRQMNLKSDDPSLTAAIKRFHDTVRDSKRRAVEYQQQYGSEPGNPIIKAGTTLLGKAAGMIDMIRQDAISKALRDDYTAYNHLAMAYTMLHTTALALADRKTAHFAETGLRTYAGLVQDINRIIPDAVVHDLKDNADHPIVNATAADEGRRTIDSLWKQTANT